MIIYDNNNQVLLDIPVDDDSYRYRALMQGKKVYLHYSLPRHVELPVGSYIEYQGERYTLWYPENFRKKGSRAFEYTVELGGNEELLKKYKFKLLSQRPPKLQFPFTATPALFLRLLVDNLNRFDSGWTVGACLEATEKALSFNHESCFDVLSRLASEFHTEWEIAGKTIHLCKVEKYKDNPVALSYGRGNGFVPGVGRANRGDKQPVTVLYVQGGEQNIAPSTYGSPSLLLPRSAELVYEGRRYQTDADGLYITRADLPLSVHTEDSFDASHIYPSRVGEVTAVQTEAGEDSEGQPVTFYNIVDTTIPDALDYRACRLPGEKATLIFQSGLLSGREFDLVQSEKELSGYDPATKTFRLVSLPEGDGWLPNERLCPAPGDKYAIFHIALPQSYICDDATRTGASWDMFREAVRYFYENEQPQFTFSGELDGIWAKRHWLEIGGRLVPGGYVNFSDTQFQPEGIAIRITGVTDYLNKPHSPRIELSNTPVAGFASDQLGKIEAEEVTNRQLHLDALSYTKRRFRDLEETGKMLEAAIEGFSSPIDPLSVVTMSLQVGSEALQFRFVGSKTDPTTVEPALRYDQRTKVFTAAAAILQHLTLGIQEIAPAHDPSAYRYWDLAGYTSPPLDDPAGLYLYAKCSRDGTAGSFELSKTPFPLEKEGFYYFLVGTLSSESGGGRSFVTVYGFTEVLPGRITTDRIVSADGNLVINLGEGTIRGYDKITDKPDLGVYATHSELSVQGGRISAAVESINRIDGTIRSAGWITEANGNTLYAAKRMEDGKEIISAIQQTPSTIKIKADKIDLTGKVSFSMLDTSLRSNIEGKLNGSVTTGSKGLESVIINGKTLIAGGYLQTELINTNEIVAKKLAADQGTIAGFTIYPVTGSGYRDCLVAKMEDDPNDSGDMILNPRGALMFNGKRKIARFGIWGVNIIQGSDAMIYLNHTVSQPSHDGIYIHANGVSQNNFIIGKYSAGGSLRTVTLGTKRFANDPDWFHRTVLMMSKMPSITQIETEPNKGERYDVKWDEGTGFLYIQK